MDKSTTNHRPIAPALHDEAVLKDYPTVDAAFAPRRRRTIRQRIGPMLGQELFWSTVALLSGTWIIGAMLHAALSTSSSPNPRALINSPDLFLFYYGLRGYGISFVALIGLAYCAITLARYRFARGSRLVVYISWLGMMVNGLAVFAYILQVVINNHRLERRTSGWLAPAP